MFALLPAAALLVGASTATGVGVLPLSKGAPVEQRISAGDLQTWEIAVRKGEYVRIEAVQRGVRTLLTLEGPGLDSPIVRYAPMGPYGVNRVYAIAP